MSYVDIAKEFEGCKLTAYLCPAKVWTIGYGHTKDVHEGQTITQEQADILLHEDLHDAIEAVHSAVKVPLTEEEEGALVDFVFNVGVGNFQKSTLLKLLNGGDYEKAAQEFGKWTRANGVVLAGLVRRRAAESALFRKGIA